MRDKYVTNKGYQLVHLPGHPRADGEGRVMEHIVVFEQATGITVPEGCCIHHLNGNKRDNRIENLCMMTHKAHTAFHNSGRVLSADTKQLLSERAKARFADERNHPSFKDVDVQRMIDMRNNGETVKHICDVFSITKTTYYRKVGNNK